MPSAEYLRIVGDPRATPEKIYWLRDQDPLAALQHPNCPVEMWWRLAADWPLEAPLSPAGQLFLLEEPARWEDLQRRKAPQWIGFYCKTLSATDERRFAIECATRVLSLAEYPLARDPFPRRALYLAKEFTYGRVQQAEITKFLDALPIRSPRYASEAFYLNPHRATWR